MIEPSPSASPENIGALLGKNVSDVLNQLLEKRSGAMLGAEEVKGAKGGVRTKLSQKLDLGKALGSWEPGVEEAKRQAMLIPPKKKGK